MVELAGIEPASSSVEPGLLRVQSVMSFSRPRCSHLTRHRQAQPGKSPSHPSQRRWPASLLDEAWVRVEGNHPVRPFGHRSGGESEVSALSVGTYRFPAIVYEMTPASRPTSPGTDVPSRNRSAPVELFLQSTGTTPRPRLRFPGRVI